MPDTHIHTSAHAHTHTHTHTHRCEFLVNKTNVFYPIYQEQLTFRVSEFGIFWISALILLTIKFIIFQKEKLSAAATAAKSLRLGPTLCDPIDSSPPDSPVPGILQARTLEWIKLSAYYFKYSYSLFLKTTVTEIESLYIQIKAHAYNEDIFISFKNNKK